jgi:hypothetical protein
MASLADYYPHISFSRHNIYPEKVQRDTSPRSSCRFIDCFHDGEAAGCSLRSVANLCVSISHFDDPAGSQFKPVSSTSPNMRETLMPGKALQTRSHSGISSELAPVSRRRFFSLFPLLR